MVAHPIASAKELADTRSFYLGFTYQPYDWSDSAFENTYSLIANNSDTISHYFDDGAPWEEAFTAKQYHSNVVNQINTRVKHTGNNQKVLVGINFLDKDRRLDPIGTMTTAIHVYGGDFFAPEEPRSEWDHETLTESPWEIEKVKLQFKEAEARFNSYKNAS